MPSKTSSCSKTLFWRNVTAFWPVWALYAAIWALILPVHFLTNGSNRAMRGGVPYLQYLSERYVMEITQSAVVAMALIFGVLCAMAVFSYLCLPRAAALHHALPIRRGEQFLAHYLAGLSFLLVPNVLIFFAALGAEAMLGIVNAGALLIWLACACGLCIFFYSLAVLLAMLTGSLLALPAFYGVAQILFAGLEVVARTAMRIFVFGFSETNPSLLQPLSPMFELVARMRYAAVYDALGNTVGYRFEGGLTVALYTLAGLALAAAALLLYRRRHTEAAGDLIAFAALRPVFKYGFTASVALSLGLLLLAFLTNGSFNGIGVGTVWPLLLCMVLTGLIGYYIAEMLLHKSFRVFRRGALTGFGIFAAVLVALSAALEFDLFGFESRLPDPARVASVSVDWQETMDPALIARAIELHSVILQNQAAIEAAERDPGGGYHYETVSKAYGSVEMQRSAMPRVRLTYTMTNGKTLARTYTIPVTRALLDDGASPAARYEAYLNEPPIVYARALGRAPDEHIRAEAIRYGSVYFLDDSFVMAQQEKRRELGSTGARFLFEAMRADFAAGRFGRTYLLRDERYYEQMSNLNITISYETGEDVRYSSYSYYDGGTYVNGQSVPVPYYGAYTKDETGIAQQHWTLELSAEETIRALISLGVLEDAGELTNQLEPGTGIGQKR